MERLFLLGTFIRANNYILSGGGVCCFYVALVQKSEEICYSCAMKIGIPGAHHRQWKQWYPIHKWATIVLRELEIIHICFR